MAPGQCVAPSGLALFDADGVRRPLQTRSLDRWPDGSVRWLLVDALVDHAGTPQPVVYRLQPEREAARPTGPSVSVTERADAIAIETGVLSITAVRTGRHVFGGVRQASADLVNAARTGLVIEGTDGPFDVMFDHCELEDGGPVRATVAWRGTARSASRLINVTLRLHVYAGASFVRMEATVHNPAAARHPGGYWELGERSSVLLRDVSFVVAAPAPAEPAEVACSAEVGLPFEQCGSTLALYQASSGGENWASKNHVDRDGVVPLPFRGYRLTSSHGTREGQRASPIAARIGDQSRLTVAVPAFWQNFPKVLAASTDGIAVHLFPRQHGALHELQPGEQKTHAWYVDFVGADGDRTLAWTRTPLFAHLRPEDYCASGAIPYLLPLAQEPHPAYAALVAGALGDDGFERKREQIDEYGWRHYGDMYADHERVYYKGVPPVHSHYNNQYDALAGLGRQFVRSADIRWWHQFCALGAHVVDIDIYRATTDKAAYNHGLFWHTAHYADAGRSTHRSYPKAEGVHGGGPSAEHNYATGLVLYHCLTGDPAAREAALGLAEWVIAMDDGNRTRFRWLSRADTGVASSTHTHDHQGPGRGAGHSIAALIDGYRLSGERRFLDKAETLIRRCAHPGDDVAARGLLDAERRWSYTIYLHVIGRYLDEKVQRGQIDFLYAYARATLLVYARWMTEHERPYFDRREELEYPTETWVAQELWKSEVLLFAARYGTPGERGPFLERAAFFFDYAIRTLTELPTRTLTRPMVLLLSRGLMNGYAARRPEFFGAPDAPPATFGSPPPAFLPQKLVAIRRAMLLIGGTASAAAAGGLWWFLQ
jgi:hypothetical protein